MGTLFTLLFMLLVILGLALVYTSFQRKEPVQATLAGWLKAVGQWFGDTARDLDK